MRRSVWSLLDIVCSCAKSVGLDMKEKKPLNFIRFRAYTFNKHFIPKSHFSNEVLGWSTSTASHSLSTLENSSSKAAEIGVWVS